MNKTFKGKLAMGETLKIRLSTSQGLTGYQIRKFQIITTDTTDTSYSLVAQIFANDPGSVTATMDFDNPQLLAIAYSDSENSFYNKGEIIFDDKKINQDMYITMADSSGGTTPANYYIELEKVTLDKHEATVATLKDMRGRE